MTNCPFSVPVPRHRASAPRLSGRPDSRCYTARTPSASGAQSTASPPALGCPTRTKFRTAVHRQSWGVRPGHGLLEPSRPIFGVTGKPWAPSPSRIFKQVDGSALLRAAELSSNRWPLRRASLTLEQEPPPGRLLFCYWLCSCRDQRRRPPNRRRGRVSRTAIAGTAWRAARLSKTSRGQLVVWIASRNASRSTPAARPESQ